MKDSSTREAAVSATLHCLTGCAIGEITGLIIGTVLGLSTMVTILISVTLAFMFGYALSLLPILKYGLGLSSALRLVLAADSLSILVMEITDNAVMTIIPGALHAGIVNPLFWASMGFSLLVAFFVAMPVNAYLLKRGQGMALTHIYHGSKEHKEAK